MSRARFVAWRGLNDGYRQVVEGHSPWTRDTKDPQPICIGDVGSADLPDALKATVKAEGIGALAFIPLMAKGALVGKFMTYYKGPHVFRETEVDLAVTIARQRGFSVERMNAVDAEHRAHARQNFLARELHHRTKNLFAVVQAIVARSFANKRTVQEAETAVRDRLHSLAQTHTILLDKDWEGADLAEVVRAKMSPYGDRVSIEGPSLMLTPQAAQNFAVALHELATNAAKYGALSNDTGRVDLSWSVLKPNGYRQFIFRWQERGGPHVTPPTGKGFGSAVLEQAMAEYFENPPQIEFCGRWRRLRSGWVAGSHYEPSRSLDIVGCASARASSQRGNACIGQAETRMATQSDGKEALSVTWDSRGRGGNVCSETLKKLTRGRDPRTRVKLPALMRLWRPIRELQR